VFAGAERLEAEDRRLLPDVLVRQQRHRHKRGIYALRSLDKFASHLRVTLSAGDVHSSSWPRQLALWLPSALIKISRGATNCRLSKPPHPR